MSPRQCQGQQEHERTALQYNTDAIAIRAISFGDSANKTERFETSRTIAGLWPSLGTLVKEVLVWSYSREKAIWSCQPPCFARNSSPFPSIATMYL
jgi:hypothetical protein